MDTSSSWNESVQRIDDVAWQPELSPESVAAESADDGAMLYGWTFSPLRGP